MSVEIQHLYLISSRPVGNTFLTLENQNTVVFDKGNNPKEYNKQTVEKGRQLYLTDAVGSIATLLMADMLIALPII